MRIVSSKYHDPSFLRSNFDIKLKDATEYKSCIRLSTTEEVIIIDSEDWRDRVIIFLTKEDAKKMLAYLNKTLTV